MLPVSGQVGWIDLTTSDVAAAQEFYRALLGWEYEGIAAGVDYAMCRHHGQLVAGMGPQPDAWRDAGMSSVWSPYVIVDDADAVVAAAAASGGFVPLPATDVLSQGRMAMVGDPSGAVIGVWAPRDHRGAELTGTGGLLWAELQSRDVAAATAFYAGLFGWRWESPPGSPDYWMAMPDDAQDDSRRCGAMAMPPNVPAEVPSFWFVYLGVDDVEASFGVALREGASALFPPMQMGISTFAGLTDPTGASFCIGRFG
jgi:predicted enzyme related to lactoylglutathione lyase